MRTCLLFVLLSLSLGLSAQEKAKESLFMISPGFMIFNNGEQYGMSYSNDYIRDINRHFSIGYKLLIGHGEGDVPGLKPQHDIHISTTAFDLLGYYQPFVGKSNRILLGVGLSIDYTRISYLSNKDFFEKDGKIYTIADTDGELSLIVPAINLIYLRKVNDLLSIGLNANLRDFSFYQYNIGLHAGFNLSKLY